MVHSAPHLVALDIDGTLVNYDGQLSPATASSVQQAVSLGHHVVVSTGRSLHASLGVVGELGLTQGYIVSSNGSQVAQILPGGVIEVIHQEVFCPRAKLEQITSLLPAIGLAVELPDGSFVAHDPQAKGALAMSLQQDNAVSRSAFPHSPPQWGAVKMVSSFADLQCPQALRIAGQATDIDDEVFHQAARELGLPGASYASGHAVWLDVGPSGVSKASALEVVRQKLAVDHCHTVAVGDGNNDIEMLQWAEWSYAMAGSNSSVQQVAQKIVGTPEENGVGQALSDCIL